MICSHVSSWQTLEAHFSIPAIIGPHLFVLVFSALISLNTANESIGLKPKLSREAVYSLVS